MDFKKFLNPALGASLVLVMWSGATSSAEAQYCTLDGALTCGDGTVCEPVSETQGLCCPGDPMTGVPGVCIGPSGPPAATVLASDLFQLLTLAQDPALYGDLFTGPWTNWYYDGRERGLAKLALMRGILETYNLHDMYVGSGVPLVTDPARSGLICETGPYTSRTLDGTCNDPTNPLMGAQGTRFGRNVPLAYGHPIPGGMLTPNPRTVSRELLRRPRNGFKPVTFLNNLAGAWTQFQIHDWFDHGPAPHSAPGSRRGRGHYGRGHGHGHGHGGHGHYGGGHGHGHGHGHGGHMDPSNFIQIPLDRDDPLRRRYRMENLLIPPTREDPTRVAGRDDALPPTFTNEVTHWWDGSQVYGSDQETADRLRAHEGGKLLIRENGLLPEGEGGYADTGMRENFWVGLELLHTVFAQEHNAIAEMLEANHPDWSDERLFDTARMINAALIAKIHTLEWTPAILPNTSLDTAMNTNWYGLNHFTCPTLPPIPGLYPNPVVYGVVGNPDGRDLHDAAYAMTEEFVSVYRMHPLLPDHIEVRNPRTGRGRRVATERTREAGGRALVERYGMEKMLYSFGTTNPGALVLENYPTFLQDINIPGRGIMDMGTTDIVRDRERGVPRYNAARQLMGLPRVADFDTLTGGDKDLSDKLEQVYGDIDLVDLMVGTMAEAQRPSCYGFGETLFQVFTLMATRRLQGDRFYTELYNADTYTNEGLLWIEMNSMKSILLRHYPELADTGLASVANAFYPWE